MGLNGKGPCKPGSVTGAEKQTGMEFFKGKAAWFWRLTSAGGAIGLLPTTWRILHLLWSQGQYPGSSGVCRSSVALYADRLLQPRWLKIDERALARSDDLG